MNIKLLLLLPAFMLSSPNWHNDLNEAERIAKKEHKYILLNFSGSDWCGPCIRMRSEFFDSEVFKKMAESLLVTVDVDFPRMKKNQLPELQQKLNDEMADKYNPNGKFPYTLLLNADGKVLWTWEGLPSESPDNFTMDIRNAIYSNPQTWPN
jgi:thioredoxin-related protein